MECVAAVGKALAALAKEDANADAAEQSGVIYRRPCSDVDKLEGGDVALGHSSALAAECHAALRAREKGKSYPQAKARLGRRAADEDQKEEL